MRWSAAGRRQAPHRETLSLIIEGLGLGSEEQAQLESAAAASRKIGHPRIRANQADHNLPHAVNSFHGREPMLRELTALLRTHRLVTLHGMGGVGKTRLATEAARACLNERDTHDGTWFINLAPVIDPAHVPSTVADVLGIREVPDEPPSQASSICARSSAAMRPFVAATDARPPSLPMLR